MAQSDNDEAAIVERCARIAEQQTRLNAQARRDRADDTLAFEFDGLGRVIAAAIRREGVTAVDHSADALATPTPNAAADALAEACKPFEAVAAHVKGKSGTIIGFNQDRFTYKDLNALSRAAAQYRQQQPGVRVVKP